MNENPVYEIGAGKVKLIFGDRFAFVVEEELGVFSKDFCNVCFGHSGLVRGKYSKKPVPKVEMGFLDVIEALLGCNHC